MQLDEAFAERLWLADAESDDPVQIFEHTWVATVFRMTLRSVRESYTSRGQERLFDVLRPWLDVKRRSTPRTCSRVVIDPAVPMERAFGWPT